MKINEIYTAFVSWQRGGKRRPVLILNINKNEVLVFKITTQYQNKSQYIKDKYYKIKDLSLAGLVKQSYIDTVKTYRLNSKKLSLQKLVSSVQKIFLNLINLSINPNYQVFLLAKSDFFIKRSLFKYISSKINRI